jgi:lysophospholipase L1-like esterase
MATIFVLGASIAFGAGDPEGGWASRLRYIIDAETSPNKVSRNLVYNLGVSGETTAELLSRIDHEVKPRCRQGHISIAVFSIGGNDAGYLTTESRFCVPPAQFTRNLETLLLVASNYCPIIFVQNLTPVVDDIASARPGAVKSKRNVYVDEYNHLLTTVCNNSSASIVDVHGLFVQEDPHLLICDDGVHPNARGHAAIARQEHQESHIPIHIIRNSKRCLFSSFESLVQKRRIRS